MPNEESPQGFVRNKLPWIAAGGALILFLLTLNTWVNLRSLPIAAKITGWDWTLPFNAPLLHTLTFPVRFLPAGIQPIALNIFTAICAALTLGLLARSVSLLPHDRTHEQRTRERSEFSLLSIKLAWVPPLLAVLVCGLQLTYWEHATAITGEALDLLIFAYVIRCLLEFRISQEDRWLSKMAFVYGLGVTNNWAMIGFFPAFLIALIWIRGLRFFDPGFLVRMVVFGGLGLLLYLLLPVVWMIDGTHDFSFFQVLQSNWVAQKTFLVNTPSLRNRALLLGLTSVLPVILMGIRWPSSFGDTSAAGSNLTNLAFRVIHLFFLGACLWVAFDPGYSPRHLGMGLPFLTFYYLAALAIGYYAGYALLVFSPAPRKSWKREEALGNFFNPIVRFAVLAALVAVPAALAYKNFSAVRAENTTMLREFAERTRKLLPAEPAYLLSEDIYQLALVQAALNASESKTDHVLVNTRSLELPAYHSQMRRHYGERWPEIIDLKDPPSHLDQVDIQQMVRGLAATNTVIYLHPSFGYFFEYLYPEPNGQVYRLRTFQTNEVLPPALSAAEIQANESFWSEPAPYLERIASLNTQESADAVYLANYYSRALNAWGVFVQRYGSFPQAQKHFARAYELNTNNVAARFNLEFNKAVQAGRAEAAIDPKEAEEMLSDYRNWDELLSRNGPVDEPEMCLMLGSRFTTQQQFRQAALQFSRTIHFQPSNFVARVSFARALVFGGWPERGLAELARLEQELPEVVKLNPAEVAAARAAAFFMQNKVDEAESVLTKARAQEPDNAMLRDSLLDIYRASGRITNALAILDQQIQRQPTNMVVQMQKAELLLSRDQFEAAQATLDSVLAASPGHPGALLFQAFGYIQEKKYDLALLRLDKVLEADPENVQALIYKGVANMELKQFEKAREAFEDALTIEPENVTALRNRAILSLRAERWSQAKEDYEELKRVAPKSHAVLYGLGEVAFHQNDHEEAKRYYESYLKHAPKSGPPQFQEERSKVEARLREIQTAKK